MTSDARTPALVTVFREASIETLCWKIGCTTCGATELRRRLRALCGEDGEQAVVPLTRTSAEALANLAAGADLAELSRAARFPDWLGYLGMLLYELERFPDLRARIAASWATQFMAMGGDPMYWGRFEGRPISYADLERAEHEALGA